MVALMEVLLPSMPVIYCADVMFILSMIITPHQVLDCRYSLKSHIKLQRYQEYM
jgi:hypothetical protein